jgi:2-polyprenyl-3-methyl-5-hydroxy-6-metoxy-1,4-benzoquinol methylase
MLDNLQNTKQLTYTNRLLNKQKAGWKVFFDVQAPYRWNLQRLKPGFTLDIGCGIGRNLINLKGRGVGIDHNLESVKIAQKLGLTAFTCEEFKTSPYNQPQQFDSLLLAHVAEHMTQGEVIDILQQYTHLLKPKGKLIAIAPQEAGYKSDATHVEFMNFDKLRNIARQSGFKTAKEFSFPFPRVFGRLFIYNEFVSVSYKQ